MTALAWVLVRRAGWPRMLLIALATALVSTLVLAALTFLRTPGAVATSLRVSTGTNGETGRILAFSSTLLLIPPLLLLYQALRLGAVARSRRFAALRLAGAASHQIGLLAGLETGLPALVGATVGAVLHRELSAAWIALAPGSALPPVGLTSLVIILVAGTGFAMGWVLVLDRTEFTHPAPVPVTRPPRPWGALLLLCVVVGFVPSLSLMERLNGINGELLGDALLGVLVLSFVSSSSWLGYRMGCAVESRATSTAALLAARRLIMEPRTPGRAAAAVGGIAVIATGAGTILGSDAASGGLQAFDVGAAAFVCITLLVALMLVSLALAVYSVETVLAGGPTAAVLAAAGAPPELIERSLRYSAAMVALPTALAGALTGAVPLMLSLLSDPPAPLVLVTIALCSITAIVLCTWAATWTATLLVRPWLQRAADPTRLRTE